MKRIRILAVIATYMACCMIALPQYNHRTTLRSVDSPAHKRGNNSLFDNKWEGWDIKEEERKTGGKNINKAGGNNLNNQRSDSGTAERRQLKVTDDTAYYVRAVKKNGWLVGIDSISADEAHYQPCYFRFTRKNNAGNWTYIEALDGYGRPNIYHNIITYLVNQFDTDDSGVNPKWLSMLQQACKWEFISDASGTEVVQERALNADGKVLYCYNPVKVGKREYTGSYVDSWGMPIFLRTDSIGNDLGYANIVHVTRDERGYEVLLEFSDRLGIPQENKDGAYKTLKKYDDNGNQIMEASLNISGGYMNDDFGNCGWTHIYENNRSCKSQFFDANLKPVRISSSRRADSDEVITQIYKQDEHGRDVEVTFVDSLGNDDVNQYGVHKYCIEYNDYGRIVSKHSYDRNNRLVGCENSGLAQTLYKYNALGYADTVEYRDANGRYVVPSFDDCCMRVFKFDYSDGTYYYRKDFVVDADGNLVMNYEFDYRDSILVEVNVAENIREETRYDQQGRKTSWEISHIDGSPVDGLQREMVTYPADNVTVNKWLDADGNYYVANADDFSSKALWVDSTNWVKKFELGVYDFVKGRFAQKYTPGFETPVSQCDLTTYNEQARVGWDDMLSYSIDLEYNMYGDMVMIAGRNEFGELSYISNVGTPFTYCISSGNNHYFDENSEEIPTDEVYSFGDRLPEAFCIEVTDTATAYPLGLRNGDIILSYGGWLLCRDLKTGNTRYYLETILQAGQEKQVTVLRHFPTQGRSEVKQLMLPRGRMSDLGFYAHKIYYTQKEKSRLLAACEEYSMQLRDTVTNGFDNYATVLLGVQDKGGLFSTQNYYLHIKDPGILLYAREQYVSNIDSVNHTETLETDVWRVRDGIPMWQEKSMFMPEFGGKSELIFTQDMNSLYNFSKNDKGNDGLNIIPIEVDMETYTRILNCLDSNSGDNIQDGIPGDKDSSELYYSMITFSTASTGIFTQSGFPEDGVYILLKFNNWHFGMDFDVLSAEIDASRDTEHSMTFIELDYDDKYTLGKLHDVTFAPGLLGVRFSNYYLPEYLYKKLKKHLK